MKCIICVAGGILLLLGIAAFVAGSMATLGALPASLIAATAVGTTIFGSMGILMQVLDKVNERQDKAQSRHGLMLEKKRQDALIKLLEAQEDFNKAHEDTIKHEIKIAKTEEEKRKLREQEKAFSMRISNLYKNVESSCRNKNEGEMKALLYRNLENVKRDINTGGTAAREGTDVKAREDLAARIERLKKDMPLRIEHIPVENRAVHNVANRPLQKVALSV